MVQPFTRMPMPDASRANRDPIAPSPITPQVLPFSSTNWPRRHSPARVAASISGNPPRHCQQQRERMLGDRDRPTRRACWRSSRRGAPPIRRSMWSVPVPQTDNSRSRGHASNTRSVNLHEERIFSTSSASADPFDQAVLAAGQRVVIDQLRAGGQFGPHLARRKNRRSIVRNVDGVPRHLSNIRNLSSPSHQVAEGPSNRRAVR